MLTCQGFYTTKMDVGIKFAKKEKNTLKTLLFWVCTVTGEKHNTFSSSVKKLIPNKYRDCEPFRIGFAIIFVQKEP